MLGKELIGKGIRQRAPSSPVCPRNIPTYNIKDVPFNHLNILESIPEKKRRVCKCCSQCPNGTKASHVCKVCQRPVQAQPVHLLNHFVAYHNTEEFFNV